MTSLLKRLATVKELTGQDSIWGLFKSGHGVWMLFDGNLFETLVVHSAKGELVGEDSFGNKYFQNKDLPYDRSRWVVYGDKFTYNATSIPPEWHGWVNYINDYPPTEYEYKKPIYYVEPYITKTGTSEAYVPKGSWTNPDKRNWKKVEFWQPPTRS